MKRAMGMLGCMALIITLLGDVSSAGKTPNRHLTSSAARDMLYVQDSEFTVPESTPNVTEPALETPEPTAEPGPGPDELSETEQKKAEYFMSHGVGSFTCKKKLEKKVKLTWKKQFGADYYTIYRSGKKKSGFSAIGTTVSSRFTDKKAKKKKTYYYYVQGHMTIRNQHFFNKKSKTVKVYVYPKKPVTVIAGECFVVGMDRIQSVFNKNHKFVGKIGVNTYTMMHNNYFTYQGQSITGLERIAYYHPDRVYYLIGANESAWTYTSFTIKNYKEMRKLLRRVNKHIEIVLVKIPPFGRTSSQNIPSVSRRASFNKAYRKLAGQYKDVFYCPATDVLDDGTSHLAGRYDGGDGCHWNDSGTVAVVKQIRKWSKKTFHEW